MTVIKSYTKEGIQSLIADIEWNKGPVGDGKNLDGITSRGLYTQDETEKALLSLNYPVRSWGFLQVFPDGDSGGYIQQYMTTSAMYIRRKGSSGWGPWTTFQGPKGDPGEKGDPGKKGDPGPQGPAGVPQTEWKTATLAEGVSGTIKYRRVGDEVTFVVTGVTGTDAKIMSVPMGYRPIEKTVLPTYLDESSTSIANVFVKQDGLMWAGPRIAPSYAAAAPSFVRYGLQSWPTSDPMPNDAQIPSSNQPSINGVVPGIDAGKTPYAFVKLTQEGRLTVSGNPIDSLDAVGLSYLNTRLGTKLDSGQVETTPTPSKIPKRSTTGTLTSSAPPSKPEDLTRKDYVDGRIQIVSALPSSPDPTVLYLIKEA